MGVKRKNKRPEIARSTGPFEILNPAASYDTILSPPAIQTCNLRFVIWDSDHREDEGDRIGPSGARGLNNGFCEALYR